MLIDSIFAHYRVQSKLGAGGMGEVYHARDTTLNRDVAIKVARSPLPLDEALPVAKQIAEALEAAHEQGVVRRDLKPANIKVRSDGTVKVLDFGLAKAMEPAAVSSPGMSTSPTLTTPAMTLGNGGGAARARGTVRRPSCREAIAAAGSMRT